MAQSVLKQLIGRRIKEVREEQGLTQPELAEKMAGEDRHPQSISKWEAGRSNASLEVLEEIAEALGVHPVTLLTLESDDYRRAMEEAATLVEGTLADLAEKLRDRGGEVDTTGTRPTSASDGDSEPDQERPEADEAG